MSSEIFYKFGKQSFTGSILAILFGIFLVGLNFLPNTHKIYLVPLVSGFMFIGLGLQYLLKSLKKAHCVRCQLEFKETALISCRKEDETNLKRALENNDASLLAGIEVIRNDVKPRCEIDLECCPKCREIGLVSMKSIDTTKTQILKDQPIRGEFIKALKTAFFI